MTQRGELSYQTLRPSTLLSMIAEAATTETNLRLMLDARLQIPN